MEEVIKLFKQIQSTSSLNEKKDIITANKDNELFKKCLRFLLDGNITTGIAEKKYDSITATTSDWVHCDIDKEFSELLDYIKTHNTGRDEDIIQVQAWCCNMRDDVKDFVRGIITKTYRLGADAKLVNKCIPGLIPTFDVQLGTSIEKVKLNGNEWISISRKLNGTRCAFIGDRCMTRQGKEYIGLDHIIKDLQQLVGTETFVDGELIYKNKEGLSDSEAFQKGTGIAMSKDNDKSELKFVVFDMFPLGEFWTGKSYESYILRKQKIINLQKKIDSLHTENIEIVPICYEGTDHSEIWKWLDYAEENDWEGVILNLDSSYECKRTKNLIKVKRFKEIDLRCTNINIATSGKYKGILGSITCKYGDSSVDIGSGFNDDKRKYYTDNPDQILNHIITIKFKEITQSKNGLKSLQFPVFVTCRNEYDKTIGDDEI